MLPLHPGILAKAIKQCSVKEVFLKILQNTGVSSGTGVSCEFWDILKNTFFSRTPEVVASGICSNQDFLFSYCM